MQVLKIVLAAGLACAATGAARGHVLLAEPTAEPGSDYVASFVTPERCGESVTTALRVTLPAGIDVVVPAPKPGWRLEITEEALAAPVMVEGRSVTRRPKEIVWEIGATRPAYDEAFTVTMRLPATTGPLYFPTVQVCAAGERRWVEIPPPGKSSHDLRRPAPVLMVEPAAGAPSGGGSGHHRHGAGHQ